MFWVKAAVHLTHFVRQHKDLRQMKKELYSPLSREECEQKLLGKLEEKVFLGWVKEQKFSLRLGKGLRNPFVPYFQGKLGRTNNGTILKGEIKIHAVVKWGMIIWGIFWILTTCLMTVLIGAGLLGLMALVGIENLRELGNETYLTLITMPVTLLSLPLVGVVFGIGFPVLFVWDGMNKREKMIEKLENILEVTNHNAAYR
jgi:Flp pilus assembly protein TadB